MEAIAAPGGKITVYLCWSYNPRHGVWVFEVAESREDERYAKEQAEQIGCVFKSTPHVLRAPEAP
jgi:hypothetical protein